MLLEKLQLSSSKKIDLGKAPSPSLVLEAKSYEFISPSKKAPEAREGNSVLVMLLSSFRDKKESMGYSDNDVLELFSSGDITQKNDVLFLPFVQFIDVLQTDFLYPLSKSDQKTLFIVYSSEANDNKINLSRFMSDCNIRPDRSPPTDSLALPPPTHEPINMVTYHFCNYYMFGLFLISIYIFFGN